MITRSFGIELILNGRDLVGARRKEAQDGDSDRFAQNWRLAEALVQASNATSWGPLDDAIG
eukprot:768232-Hanusia_phi.AAC.3